MATRYILGSSSKWRQNIAKKGLGVQIELFPAEIDEKAAAIAANPQTPEDHVKAISLAKLNHLLGEIDTPNTVIMCFDTIVYHGRILEKPNSKAECRDMINLWGKKNLKTAIYTGVAIGLTEARKVVNVVERADVIMTRNLTDDEVTNEVENSPAMTSSGSMIVEDLIDLQAAIIDGDQTVIEGFPLERVKSIIQQLLH